MKQIFRISILVSVIVFLFSFAATSGEEEVLQALETVKTRVEEGISPEGLAGLLDEAKIQIDALEQDDIPDDCFGFAVRRCHYWYNSARMSRDTMIKNQERRDECDIKAIFGEEHMKATYATMVVNYEKLLRHTYEALPTKWAYGNAALEGAHKCLKEKD
ncbi:MAG: hypothetical protein JRF64_05065 [Deltaproteobacteria bacterium]|nr:hypothetical protein [Deltaproteobacteria bacterium]MBW2174006.1 hypothetical protein [Deltaproteobacteria bacterium]MBW2565825.1 hypothetical protein [Deltaproteobacteria bacterium]